VERTFTHPGGTLDVSLEVRARWGVDVVGAILRRPALIALNAPPGNGDGGNPPPTVPVDPLAVLTNLVTGLEGDIDLSERMNVMLRARMDAIKTEMVRVRGG
jgi:hypothetical protein